MFHDLPEVIQQQILSYLEADNFSAARDLRDAFKKQMKKEEQQNSFTSIKAAENQSLNVTLSREESSF